MALTAEDLQAIDDLINTRIQAAANPPRAPRPPTDLVYEGNGKYWSESTQSYFQKGGGGTLIKTGPE